MLYTDIVSAIRGNTLEELHEELRVNCDHIRHGSTRVAYMMSHWVVKIDKWGSMYNAAEYLHYSRYLCGDACRPVVFTRMYSTLDEKIVLIQERLFSTVSLMGRAYNKSGVEIKREHSYTLLELDDIAKEIPDLDDMFLDGLQMGRNSRGKLVFYDVGR